MKVITLQPNARCSTPRVGREASGTRKNVSFIRPWGTDPPAAAKDVVGVPANGD